MAYITYADVIRTTSVPITVISQSSYESFIQEAENAVCRLTKNIYWHIEAENQSATSGTNNTIVKTGAGWTTDQWKDYYVWVYSGTGSEQIRKISSNDATTLTVDRNWTTTNPDNTAKFRIFYVPSQTYLPAQFNPYVSDSYDGNNENFYFLPYYPVNVIETLAIQGTSVTISSGLYLYKKTGQITLKSGSEYGRFTASPPQGVVVTYWYGVPYLPYEIKRLTELHAGISALGAQMGGTYNAPGSISLPDMSVSVGQQYINIRSTLETLKEEYNDLLNKIVKIYPVFG